MHQLFNGTVRNLEDYANPDVLAWGERNLGVTCATLENMAAMQEAAVTADVLLNGGECDAGLDHFARSATCLGQKGQRYDYASFISPWSAPVESKAVQESFAQLEPWTKRAKRPDNEQHPRDAPEKAAKAAATKRARGQSEFLTS